jgi:hypothetical protein
MGCDLVCLGVSPNDSNQVVNVDDSLPTFSVAADQVRPVPSEVHP